MIACIAEPHSQLFSQHRRQTVLPFPPSLGRMLVLVQSLCAVYPTPCPEPISCHAIPCSASCRKLPSRRCPAPDRLPRMRSAAPRTAVVTGRNGDLSTLRCRVIPFASRLSGTGTGARLYGAGVVAVCQRVSHCRSRPPGAAHRNHRFRRGVPALAGRDDTGCPGAAGNNRRGAVHRAGCAALAVTAPAPRPTGTPTGCRR